MTQVGLAINWNGKPLEDGQQVIVPANYGQRSTLWRRTTPRRLADGAPWGKDPNLPAGTTGQIQVPPDAGANVGAWPAPLFNQVEPVNNGQLNKSYTLPTNASFAPPGVAGSTAQDQAAQAAAGAALLGGG